MKLLPHQMIQGFDGLLEQARETTNAFYRMILFSPKYSDDDLLALYQGSHSDLRQIMSIKNAQMEAQSEEEAQDYLRQLQQAMEFVMGEILEQRVFEKVGDLMQLLRLVSPESHNKHPNSFRRSLVQVGRHICPEPEQLESLMQEFFYAFPQIENRVIRAIYIHHELVRIHPFVDGNGRVARMAKNWMLMFDLYPPIFISNEEREDYRNSLSASFEALRTEPSTFPEATRLFFEAELLRLQRSCDFVSDRVASVIR